jgi:hypothetical protein
VGALSIEEVLAAEADEIHGKDWRTKAGPTEPQKLVAQADQLKLVEENVRVRINADQRDGKPLDHDKVETRKKFYRSLNKLNRAALCCSGGGIRSATFCLGVIQALAAYDVMSPAPTPPNDASTKPTADKPVAPPRPKAAIKPENSLLGRFHYLSTVSGGGYVGSWLSSWRARNDFPTVIRNLTGRPDGADVEPPEISWLRAYSNYLTPRIGIGSADTWAAIAIVVRNLLLNWLIILPVVCLGLLALKIIATVSVWVAHGGHNDQFVMPTLVLAILCLVVAQGFTTRHRPARRPPPPDTDSTKSVADPAKQVGNDNETKAEGVAEPPKQHHEADPAKQVGESSAANVESVTEPPNQPGNASQTYFVWGDFIWAIVSAIAVAIVFTSVDGVGWVTAGRKDAMIVTAGASVAIYAVGWILGFRFQNRWFVDFICWALSGLIYGALIGLGAGLYTLLLPYGPDHDPSNSIWCLLLPVIFGVPWVLLSQLISDTIFGGLVSYEAYSDSDREWLGRAAGWLGAIAVVWAIIAFLVFAGGYAVQFAIVSGHKIVVAAGGVTGVISGVAAALLGSSAKTPAKSSSDDQGDLSALACNIGLAVAGPIFAAVLIIGLSVGLDKLLLDGSLVTKLQNFTPKDSISPILGPLSIGAGITFVIGWIASYFVNINRFSLHAIYRNRLIRAYLGASRQKRYPDLFTGFDVNDNIRMHELWSKTPAENVNRLFHVINIALNVVSTKRLAWQERKAESFTVSPLHSGSAFLGFRPSEEYGDSERTATGKAGVALGTAMAISGAAVSPNMGYHSSPSVTLLLALFNVRLGWWLGNPGPPGDRHDAYRREGPRFAAKPLLYEAFGQTTDQSSYVYLSDGGHFEDLGLYEMVRRRCRFIVVIDVDCDPDFAFEDLGNAVRKIYIDLGVRIKFEGLEALRNRPSFKDDGPLDEIPYYALGTIEYESESADGHEAGTANGRVLYIKPAYHGAIEGAGVRSYAMANKAFPHETTIDQWFTESQFESYRSLGLDITKNILGQEIVLSTLLQFLKAPEKPKTD